MSDDATSSNGNMEYLDEYLYCPICGERYKKLITPIYEIDDLRLSATEWSKQYRYKPSCDCKYISTMTGTTEEQ